MVDSESRDFIESNDQFLLYDQGFILYIWKFIPKSGCLKDFMESKLWKEYYLSVECLK